MLLLTTMQACHSINSGPSLPSAVKLRDEVPAWVVLEAAEINMCTSNTVGNSVSDELLRTMSRVSAQLISYFSFQFLQVVQTRGESVEVGRLTTLH